MKHQSMFGTTQAEWKEWPQLKKTIGSIPTGTLTSKIQRFGDHLVILAEQRALLAQHVWPCQFTVAVTWLYLTKWWCGWGENDGNVDPTTMTKSTRIILMRAMSQIWLCHRAIHQEEAIIWYLSRQIDQHWSTQHLWSWFSISCHCCNFDLLLCKNTWWNLLKSSSGDN